MTAVSSEIGIATFHNAKTVLGKGELETNYKFSFHHKHGKQDHFQCKLGSGIKVVGSTYVPM